MSTAERVQVKAQAKTLDSQGFIPRSAVKIMTFAGFWQNLDAAQELS